jgi:hypothetical protein
VIFWLWMFWYCYDDSLASWVGSDVVGRMPFGMWATIFTVLVFGYFFSMDGLKQADPR